MEVTVSSELINALVFLGGAFSIVVLMGMFVAIGVYISLTLEKVRDRRIRNRLISWFVTSPSSEQMELLDELVVLASTHIAIFPSLYPGYDVDEIRNRHERERTKAKDK